MSASEVSPPLVPDIEGFREQVVAETGEGPGERIAEEHREPAAAGAECPEADGDVCARDKEPVSVDGVEAFADGVDVGTEAFECVGFEVDVAEGDSVRPDEREEAVGLRIDSCVADGTARVVIDRQLGRGVDVAPGAFRYRVPIDPGSSAVCGSGSDA